SRRNRGTAVFATLLLLTGCGRDFPPQPLRRADAPGQPLPRELVAAWTEAGAGLKELAALNGLQALGLGGTKVTDAGLKELAALKGLQRLYLHYTKVT